MFSHFRHSGERREITQKGRWGEKKERERREGVDLNIAVTKTMLEK